jgi:cbb3-type cytochrome oxidase maturation protein
MTVILYLLGISLVLGAGGLALFLWSLRSGQYDDMEGAANRILFDDEPTAPGPTRPARRVR